MRIISVVPSVTELLYDLGLDEEVVGITKFCIHPEKWFRTKTRVGGPKKLKIDIIRELKPDLILANKEENIKEEIEACAAFCKVHVDNISNYSEALEMIQVIGKLTGKETAAIKLIREIEIAFQKLKPAKNKSQRIVYMIWKNPLMTVGGDTYINNMLQMAGFKNIFADRLRYPVITEEELSDANPEVLILSSEPYPFTEKHVPYFRNLLPDTKILLADGEMFTWYGSRMRLAPDYFLQLQDEKNYD